MGAELQAEHWVVRCSGSQSLQDGHQTIRIKACARSQCDAHAVGFEFVTLVQAFGIHVFAQHQQLPVQRTIGSLTEAGSDEAGQQTCLGTFAHGFKVVLAHHVLDFMRQNAGQFGLVVQGVHQSFGHKHIAPGSREGIEARVVQYPESPRQVRPGRLQGNPATQPVHVALQRQVG